MSNPPADAAPGVWRKFSPDVPAELQRIRDRPGRIEDYADREGYDPAFFPEQRIGLPALGLWSDDAAELDARARRPKNDPHELAYKNFSVVVSKSRRLPLFSLVNVAGDLSDRDVDRTDVWQYDPRIDTQYQILRECYGVEGNDLFSRGHMTRREDPNWGPDAAVADADTFHATNACPQRQRFNAGLWLALENYVLNNVDREDIRATVITGPVLRETDPIYQGVQTPVEFWKILIYRHPELQALAALAYKRSQATFLPALGRRDSRFVFGDFQDTQVSIRGLEDETGLDFAEIRELDVMRSASAGMAIALQGVEDAFLTP